MTQESEWFKEADKYYKEIEEHNNKIFSELNAPDDFENLLDGCSVTEKMTYVDKPGGQSQNEKYGIFKAVWVDQWSVGDSGDSFEGYIYAQMEQNKWLKIPYSC